MIENAAKPFYLPEVRNYIEYARKAHDQIIDTVNIDKVNVADWDGKHKEKARALISSFKQFSEEHKDEIIALSIIYNQSWKNRPLTLAMIKELDAALTENNLSLDRLWSAYETLGKVKAKSNVRMLTDIVSLLRYELGFDKELRPYSDLIDYNFKKWIFAQNAGPVHFTDEQMEWLRMIKEHIASSLCITLDDLDLSPFDHNGGRGKFYTLFGDKYEAVLDEINLMLTA
jgi:type I restriction enzyme R subunit